MTAAITRDQVERIAASARISRMALNAACRPNDDQIDPVPDEQPPERQGDRHARREADDRQARRLPEGGPGDADDVREREDQRGADDPPPDAEPWTHAVVARPRKSISWPTAR